MNDEFDLKESKKLLGERLKFIRKSNKTNLVKLESMFPITRNTMYALEKGEGSINSLLIYMYALGVSKTFFDSFFKNYISRASFFSNNKSNKQVKL